MSKTVAAVTVLALFVFAILGGCGGGGGSNVSPPATISGVAASGAPLTGTVYLKDSSTPPNVLTDVLDSTGSFTFPVDGLKPPFLLKAGAAGHELCSFATGAGTANINPISHLALSNAAGVADPTTLYNTGTAADLQRVSANLSRSVAEIIAALQPLLTRYGVIADPISGHYEANHLELDGILDQVNFSMSTSGVITITNRATGLTVFNGTIGNIPQGSFHQNNMPVPLVVVTVDPATATVKLGQSFGFTASMHNASDSRVVWSVVEGTSGGTVTQAGVFTTSTVEGTYHVKATSVSDPTKYATTEVTVTSGPVLVTAISPSPASLVAGNSLSFSATVTGTSRTQVNWSVVEGAAGGSISSSGVYSAPSTAGTYHIKATSISDLTQSMTLAVTVLPAPRPFPFGTWTGPNGVSFTVSDLVVAGPILNQYSGSVTFSGGTMNVIGTDPMNMIMGGQGLINFAVSQVGATSGVTVSFNSVSPVPSYANQVTGVLGINHIPYSGTDYINTNAVFTRH
jgi:hypothetical protein